MSDKWKAYKAFVYKNCTSSTAIRTSVEFWKDRLFAASVVYFIPLCLIALIPSLYLSVITGTTGILISDILGVGTIVIIAFLPGISVHVRKLFFNGALYTISVVLFYYLGYSGPGMLYLLAVSIFVVLSMETIFGYIAFGLNTFICILFGFLIHFELFDQVLNTQYQLDIWIGISSNLIFLSGTAVLLIPHLFKGLQTSIDEQNHLQEKLEVSLDRIKLSEQRFKALVQDGADMISIIDENGRFKYIAPTIAKVLDQNIENMIGTNVFSYIHPEDRERNRLQVTGLPFHEQVKLKPYRFKNSEGEWHWMETTLTNMVINEAVNGYVANSQDLTEQITYQQKLEESLQEKDTLLAEIHHRVKNNLAVITSLMELQAMKSDKDELRDLLRMAQRRIQTIATIHELLYNAESLSYINFGENITHLVKSIEDMYEGEKQIITDIDAHFVAMNIAQAIPCALIVNEVITNAFKHAFEERESGRIYVRLFEENAAVCIEIEDDGVGLPENFTQSNSTSIGMTIIHSLKEQLDGDLKFSSRDDGTTFSFSFRKTDVR